MFLGREIELRDESEGRPPSGYLARPHSARGPGVLVLHAPPATLAGRREACERLAREGFVALAPALEDPGPTERSPDTQEVARRHAGSRIASAIGTLFDEEATQGPKLGCVGFGAAGSLALAAAARERRLGALVLVDACEIPRDVEPTQLRVPVLGLFAQDDPTAAEGSEENLERNLKKGCKSSKIIVFRGSRRGFLECTRGEVHDARLAAQAWGELLAFLRAELGS